MVLPHYSYSSSSRLVWRASQRHVRRYLSSSPPPSHQHPIIIVGGGPTGLFLAHLLQWYQIPFQLLEAQTPEQRFRHPQAHFLNTRTMEVLKHFGNGGGNGKDVYTQILQAMPPVTDWNHFHFGYNMTQHPPLAQVVHPVDRPILAQHDANGKLVVLENENEKDGSRQQQPPSSIPLSDCSVGHLAQHTFCQILYDSLNTTTSTTNDDNNNHNPNPNLMYGTRVVDRYRDDKDVWHLHTDTGHVYSSNIVVAADGANSEWRDHLTIPMHGQPVIQHLMNVHFTTTLTIPPAMLYTLFNPAVLGMVVRHSPHEYVLQIPYFPPYQTPAEDFTLRHVQTMVRAALGITSNNNADDFEIQSIRPWTMGSLLASQYYKQGVFLVGDAAHVFPPAGGLGMNTGLQDVFSLAWRLGMHNTTTTTTTTSNSTTSIGGIGQWYETERQPIARQNAALSVRNYRRVLGVMEACYLQDHLPTALIQGLDATAAILPLRMRRHTFQTLLQTALWPFSQLRAAAPNNNSSSSTTTYYAKHIAQKLQTLLQSGQGLPLVFPQHEVGFVYGSTTTTTQEEDQKEDWSKDTWAPSPTLVRGGLFPHMVVVRVSDGDDESPIPSGRITTTRDLPAQLATPAQPITFCVLHIRSSSSSSNTRRQPPPPVNDTVTERIAKTLQTRYNIPCTAAQLIVTETGNPPPNEEEETNSTATSSPLCVTMYMDQAQWNALNLVNDDDDNNNSSNSEELLVIIRPDGHVASIVRHVDSSNNNDDDDDDDTLVLTQVLQDLRLCLHLKE